MLRADNTERWSTELVERYGSTGLAERSSRTGLAGHDC